MFRKIRIGLALGSGGARGLANLGVIKALEEEKIPIYAIAGTSMGSIVGGVYAQRVNFEETKELILKTIYKFNLKENWLEFLSHSFSTHERGNLLQEVGHFLRKKYMSLLSANKIALEKKEKLLEPLKMMLKDEPIERAKIRFAAVAIDLISGKEITLKHDSIIDAVYASSAMQAIFPPLAKDNMLLCDGGLTGSVPIQTAKELGAEITIGVAIPQPLRTELDFNNGLEILLRSDAVGLNKLHNISLAAADVVIHPQVKAIHWGNFIRAEELIEKGYDAAKSQMKQIRKLISPKRNLRYKRRKTTFN
jgi:NTE family protein